MAEIKKIDPVGIDARIDSIQSAMYLYLGNQGWTNYESYQRAYILDKNGGTVPEVYTGANEYKEVLMNDKFNATSFFLVEDVRTFADNLFTQTVSIIFQADIVKLYPTIAHRADEEMHKDIIDSLIASGFESRITNLTVGQENVYSALSIPASYLERIKLDDVSNFHIVKIDLEIPYQFCN